MPTAAKRRKPLGKPTWKKEGLTSYRWSVGFDEEVGPIVQKEALKQGTKAGIWLRTAALQRLEREGLLPPPKG